MSKYAVGSVPYLNAKPLVKPFIWAGDESPIRVMFDLPSRLPALLDSGEVQAILVSSIAALQDPASTIAAGLSISSQQEVLSVRLFSKVPIEQIESLAEDRSSMTSNALARLILQHRYGVKPRIASLPPDPELMLRDCDACLMIGDNGMRFEGAGLHVLDLGHEWYRLTGLPFVWAVWKGRAGLTPELVGDLQGSLEESRRCMRRVVREAASETGFTHNQCSNYLERIMDYRLEPEQMLGLELFGKLLLEAGMIRQTHVPQLIESAQVSDPGPLLSRV